MVPGLADWCSVSVPKEDGTIERVAVAESVPEMFELERRLRTGLQVRPGLTLSMADVLRASKPVTAELPAEPTPGWVLLKPIRAVGVAIGILTLVNRSDRRAFSSEEIRLARAVADRAGVAVLNAKLADERAKIAEALQRELLPPLLPEVEGWSMAAMYRPAGEQNRAGGDFYDVFEGHEGWVVVLGDVEGHGPEAAALTAQGPLHDPHRGDDQRRHPGRLPDPQSSAARAQAAPPLQRRLPHFRQRPRGHGRLGRPPAAGPGLGRWDAARSAFRARFSELWRSLNGRRCGSRVERGEELVLYTDGVVEARRDGERFGRERLGSLLGRFADPAATVQGIGAAIEGFGELVHDDVAMVVLRRDSDPAVPALQLPQDVVEPVE